MALSASDGKQRGRETCEDPGSPSWPQHPQAHQQQRISPRESRAGALSHVHSPAAAGPQLPGAVCSVLPLQGQLSEQQLGEKLRLCLKQFIFQCK